MSCQGQLLESSGQAQPDGSAPTQLRGLFGSSGLRLNPDNHQNTAVTVVASLRDRPQITFINSAADVEVEFKEWFWQPRLTAEYMQL